MLGFVRVILAAVALVVAGCSRAPATGPATTQAAGLSTVPVTVSVKQRSTTAVPGSDGRLSITVDDVTRGQVMTTLATTDAGTSPLPTRSMSPGDQAEFQFGGTTYVLTLERLDNALVGQDAVTFVISASGRQALSESDKVERLIQSIAGLQGAAFVRNGSEHTAAEAAKHLNMKWRSQADKVTTARQFIEHLASKSSVSGHPYQIRFSDGRVVNAGEFLTERLRELEGGQ